MIEPTYPFQRQQQEEKPEQTSRNTIQQGITHIKCNKFINSMQDEHIVKYFWNYFIHNMFLEIIKLLFECFK